MRRLMGLFVLTALALGCIRETTAPGERAPVSGPSLAISDARHNAGNEHFFFLPPVVSQPHATGVFDGSLDPVVEICEWADSCGAVIGRFTRRPHGSHGRGARDDDDDDDDFDGNFVVKKARQHYSIDWNTKRCVNGRCSLDPAKTYRIRIMVAGVELGFADVDLVANKPELRNVETNDFIGLINGKSLQVKFRIEVGAIHLIPATGGGTPVTPAEGGTVATADGKVQLAIPAGALPPSGAPTTITVTPIASPPPDPAAVPGTTFEFGPDGTQFNQPVPLSIAYDPAQVPANVTERRLRLFTLVAGIWKLVPGSQVDEALHRVTGLVSHFSTYHVGALPPLGDLTTDSRCGVFMPDVGDFDTQWYCTFPYPNEPDHPSPGQKYAIAVWMWDAPYSSNEMQPTPFGGYDFTATSSNPAVISIDSVWNHAAVLSRCPVLAPNPAACDEDFANPAGAVWVSTRGTGDVVITIASEGHVATQNISAEPPRVASMQLAPPPILTVGGDHQLQVDLVSQFGFPLTDRVITWSTENPAIATVSTNGVLLGVAGGCTRVFAVSEGIESYHQRVTVTPAPPLFAYQAEVSGNWQLFVAGADGPLYNGATTPACDPRPLVPDPTASQRDITWSPNGSKLAFTNYVNAGSWGSIHVVNADGSGHQRISPPSLTANSAQWSHDGSRVAFMGQSMTDGTEAQIWIVAVDGTGLRMLTDPLLGQFGYPEWSPDDSRLVFQGPFPGSQGIYISNADGTGMTSLGCGFQPHWSPDGTRLAFLSCDGVNLVTMAPDGTGVQQVATGHLDSYLWSPSGTQFLLYGPSLFRHAIEVINLDGSGRRVLTSGNDVCCAVWAPDGNSIYFSATHIAGRWDISRGPVNGYFQESHISTGINVVVRP